MRQNHRVYTTHMNVVTPGKTSRFAINIDPTCTCLRTPQWDMQQVHLLQPPARPASDVLGPLSTNLQPDAMPVSRFLSRRSYNLRITSQSISFCLRIGPCGTCSVILSSWCRVLTDPHSLIAPRKQLRLECCRPRATPSAASGYVRQHGVHFTFKSRLYIYVFCLTSVMEVARPLT